LPRRTSTLRRIPALVLPASVDSPVDKAVDRRWMIGARTRRSARRSLFSMAFRLPFAVLRNGHRKALKKGLPSGAEPTILGAELRLEHKM
jgi:hypothetical protein